MNKESNTTETAIDANTVLAVVFRPKTRGELLNKLKNGIKCEVVASNEEITSICLDGWMNFAGKYKTYPSENAGWIIYESVPKWKSCQNCDCGEFPKRRCDCGCHD
jgi:hypothetical protein